MGTSILLVFLAPLMAVYAAFQGVADFLGFGGIFELEQIINFDPDAMADFYAGLQSAAGYIGALIGMIVN